MKKKTKAKAKKNPYIGESFDDFLHSLPEEEQAQIRAIGLKHILAHKAREEMKKQGIGITKLQKSMNTSRSQIQRILDAENTGISLKNIVKLYTALGKDLEISIK